jgi:hypothetical protein
MDNKASHVFAIFIVSCFPYFSLYFLSPDSFVVVVVVVVVLAAD